MVVERNAQRFDELCKSCPQCTIVGSAEQRNLPPLIPMTIHIIPDYWGGYNGTFGYSPRKQIFNGFQDLFTKWPMGFPAPDQKLNELCDCLLNR